MKLPRGASNGSNLIFMCRIGVHDPATDRGGAQSVPRGDQRDGR
jgi:hypothetical protein